MSLKLYDEAFVSKLKNVFPNVVSTSPEDVFSPASKEGSVKMPLIIVYRLNNPPNFNSLNQAEVFRGRWVNTDNDNAQIMEAIQLLVTYQLDLYAVQRDDCDTLYRDVLFYLLKNPNLTLNIPYYENPLDFSLRLTDVDNDTEVTSFKDIGRLYRTVMTYEIENARFFNLKQIKLAKDIPIETFSL